MVIDRRLRKWVNFFFFVLGFSLVFALGSAFAAESTATAPSETVNPIVRDQTLLAAVETGLKLKPDLAGYALAVSAQDSVVTLTGLLPTVSLRMLALDVAARTSGVRGVVSRIEVDPSVKPKPASIDHPRAEQPAAEAPDRALID